MGIEEPIAAGLEPGDQMDKRHLGGIANAVEHALAEECAAKCHSVKSADQLVALIYFQTMAVAALVKLPIEQANAGIDPGPLTTGPR